MNAFLGPHSTRSPLDATTRRCLLSSRLPRRSPHVAVPIIVRDHNKPTSLPSMLSGVWYENKDRPRIEPLRRSDFLSSPPLAASFGETDPPTSRSSYCDRGDRQSWMWYQSATRYTVSSIYQYLYFPVIPLLADVNLASDKIVIDRHTMRSVFRFRVSAWTRLSLCAGKIGRFTADLAQLLLKSQKFLKIIYMTVIDLWTSSVIPGTIHVNHKKEEKRRKVLRREKWAFAWKLRSSLRL